MTTGSSELSAKMSGLVSSSGVLMAFEICHATIVNILYLVFNGEPRVNTLGERDFSPVKHYILLKIDIDSLNVVFVY